MPIQYVFFDCDSTLVQIEGIVELARLKGKAEEIAIVMNKLCRAKLSCPRCLVND